MGGISKRLLSLACLLLFFSSLPQLSKSPAADIISPGHSVSRNQTVVSRGGTFEMGFFTPGNSHNYYVGIWYKEIPVKTYVWVANREAPLMETSYYSSYPELKISDDGNLAIISNHLKSPAWSTNSTHPSPASSIAVLLDTGNLILTDRSNTSAVFWQSFDHPTNTWLPGSWLGLNKQTGENRFLASWKNLEDPAPGFFSYKLDGGGSSEYFLVWNKTRRYWRTGNWTGSYFSLLPEMRAYGRFNFTFVDNQQGSYGTFPPHRTIFSRGTVSSSGQFHFWIWVSKSQEWLLIWSAPSSQCAAYSLCGAFSVCNDKSTLPCRCLQGDGNASTNGTKDGFLAVPDVRLPDDPKTLDVQIARECESACLSSSNCTAYSFHGGCSIWDGNLLNLQQLSDGDEKARTLFLRLAAAELTGSSSKKNKVTKLTVGAALGIIALVFVALGIARWQRRRLGSRAEAAQGSLVQFTYSDL